MSIDQPILYSFRRCPFAIRARMALLNSGIRVVLREVKLSQMPASMIALSAKATVPVLVLADGAVIDQSLDIMRWSLSISDPHQWLHHHHESARLIQQNDEQFKPLLDHYKYADRYPQLTQQQHRQNALFFLQQLNQRLTQQAFLINDQPCLADMAILPFIRQFAGVEPDWFSTCEYSKLRQWLSTLLETPLFTTVMQKYPIWQPDDEVVYL